MTESVAWITGASGGIGAGIARALAQQGISLAIGYYRNKEQAQRLADSCRQQGIEALPVACDVTDWNQMRQAYRKIQFSLGAPTILIHCAGIAQVGLFQDMTKQDYDRVMDTHVRGAFYFVQTGLPYLIQQKTGRIILISSIWGETGGAGEVLYSAAKGAINGMTKALAKELAPSGITVNAVAPGAIQTDMLQAQLTEEEQLALADEIPIGRLGRVDEVGSLVGYLCSPAAAYITGQVIHVNGGWYT